MRTEGMQRRVDERLKKLCENFGYYVDSFDSDPPFKRYGQLEFHRETIRRRRDLLKNGDIGAVINDTSFMGALYDTLLAWGANRGGKLATVEEISRRMLENMAELMALGAVHIDASDLNAENVGLRLYRLFERLRISSANNMIVASSKAVHHVLPDLVPPVDRRYTRAFFGWYGPQFQYQPETVFMDIFRRMVEIAKAATPRKYVDGQGWHTSSTKILDNAITAFCRQEGLTLP